MTKALVARLAPFSGEWEDDDEQVMHVKGGFLFGADGSKTSLSLKDADTLCFKVGKESYEATLSEDGDKLLWADGSEWVRHRIKEKVRQKERKEQRERDKQFWAYHEQLEAERLQKEQRERDKQF